MKATNAITVILSSLILAACSIERAPNPVEPPWPYEACDSIAQQDAKCQACAAEFEPAYTTVEGGAFDECYENKESGALTGDGDKCAAQHPKGAQEWKSFVSDVCDSCAFYCCYFCGSPYGILKP